MAVGAEAEKSNVEQRPRWIQDGCTIGCLQSPLIAQGALLGGAVGRHGMDVLWRDGHLAQHGLAGHSVIALRMIMRNEALIAPIPRNPRPGKTSAEIVGCK